ncbi:nuclear factor 7, brain-like [Scleropages formosus]|nr:nuclear factor 7, brain-like [Scleropages formosus]
MAMSGLLQELRCPICLEFFNNPTTLPCEHTFCHSCIQGTLVAQGPRCPECRATFLQDQLRPNRILRNMVDRVHTELGVGTCPMHQECLRMFCVTDQRLTCVVCRDAKEHYGHVFQPISEAAATSKEELNMALGFLLKDNSALKKLISLQRLEIQKTKDNCHHLLDNIGVQFKVLHQFLRQREQQLKKEVKDQERELLTPLEQHLLQMEQTLKERLKMEEILQAKVDLNEPNHFQQWWIDEGSLVIEGLKNKEQNTMTDLYKSEVCELQMSPDVGDSISLGPYLSHLQFFVWKEMLKVIKPVPDRVAVAKRSNSCLVVSSDSRSVRHVDSRTRWGSATGGPEFSMCHTWSDEGFRAGKHYWEVDVGKKSHWSLGLDAQSASSRDAVCRLNSSFGKHRVRSAREILVDLQVRPTKIGTFLDCERKRVSFYNADDMSLIHSCSYDTDKSLFVYFNPGFYFKGENADPLVVIWY